MAERLHLAVITGKRRRARPDLYLHGADFYLSDAVTKARLLAENPNISTAQWRNALLAVVNEANHFLMYPSKGDDRLIEAVRRATVLLSHDARTAPRGDA
ncbi:hypothetical protein Q5W_15365 [Hydrogenophaga sp. PBC]|uniref:hypothetical protein n=1 Tax=Hydrogenophaga sp. PBC TaxID=795665 RepID=UPI0002606DDE|nr:hypothetical protein [Hydrogenophaga sp. PBC]AOS80248.1 hypothetical protein Q5W_15365 [Hydrogenophaga sp. PBC]